MNNNLYLHEILYHKNLEVLLKYWPQLLAAKSQDIITVINNL